jgi:hypothetical protein
MKLRGTAPLDYFEMRRACSLPPHFEVVHLPLGNMHAFLNSTIETWIVQNLKGRFYIGFSVQLDNDIKLRRVLTVGFEKPSESSLFMIACPYSP